MPSLRAFGVVLLAATAILLFCLLRYCLRPAATVRAGPFEIALSAGASLQASQSPDGTLNVNETIGLGERALPILRQHLERRR